MRHTVLLKSLTYSHGWKISYFRVAPPLLVVSRQIFNALSPLIVGQARVVESHLPPEFTHRVLMRADSFRFATSIVFDEECTTDQACEILLRMDVVQHVHVSRGIIFVDDLTPTLLHMPHLMTVDLSSTDWFSYAQTIRPLLQHPRESVRRSAAEYASSALRGLFLLQTDEIEAENQFEAAIRDDIIPLLDNAATNGAISDYLRAFPSCWSDRFPLAASLLSEDVVRMICARAFTYLTSPTAHQELLEQSLDILCRGADRARCEIEWELDVLEAFPVLDRVLELYRNGRLRFKERHHHRGQLEKFFEMMFSFEDYTEQFFKAGVLEVLCEGIESPTQLLDPNSALGRMIKSARQHDAFQLLKTGVPRTLLRCTLLPLHNRVMSEALRLRRRGIDENRAFARCRGLLTPDQRREVTAAVKFFVSYLRVFAPRLLGSERKDLARWGFGHIVYLLFDEEQFHLGPVLRTCLLLVRPRDDLIDLVYACLDEGGTCRGNFFEAAESFWDREAEQARSERRRRMREEFGTHRFYIAEFCQDEQVSRAMRAAKEDKDREFRESYS